MSNLLEHAAREFLALGYIPPADDPEDGPNKWMQNDVLELLKVFADQGHSGSSAPYCISLFEKLARYQPLGPLTGADEEWCEVADSMWQNKRCGEVFKDSAGGQAYHAFAIIFEEENGSCYTNVNSRKPITFPYTPEVRYVKVNAEGWPIEEKDDDVRLAILAKKNAEKQIPT